MLRSRPVRSGLILLLVTAVACPSGGATGRSRARPSPARPCGTVNTAPRIWRHVVWILMENKSLADVIGSGNAPYLNRLARSCGTATNFHAESHPSLPNYLALTSGSTQGITDDGPPAEHPLAAPSIFSQLGSHWQAL